MLLFYNSSALSNCDDGEMVVATNAKHSADVTGTLNNDGSLLNSTNSTLENWSNGAFSRLNNYGRLTNTESCKLSNKNILAIGNSRMLDNWGTLNNYDDGNDVIDGFSFAENDRISVGDGVQLSWTQVGDDLLLTTDGIHTTLLDVDKDKFLAADCIDYI